MGFVSRLVETISFGCRPRALPVEEVKNCYDDNRRSVIPVAQEVIVATNECGEEIVIFEPKLVSYSYREYEE